MPESMQNGHNTDDSLRTRVLQAAEQAVAKHRIPLATYRLQMNAQMDFQRLRRLIPYFAELGITDLYLSPILRARPGSSHGYDVCDHNRLNPDLGSDEDLRDLGRELARHEMGILLDIVPNHMGVNHESNELWFDVLENGPSSIYASYFDIDWDPAKPELKDKILLPILEDQYGNTLESGQFRLVFEGGAFFVYYRDLRLPIAPRTSSLVLCDTLEAVDHDEVSPVDVAELRSILTALGYLPPRTDHGTERMEERNREKEIIKRRSAFLYESNRAIREAIDNTVRSYNGVAGDPRSFDKLDALLESQVYQPAFWRVAGEEINYRRFFDINDLAAIRTELPQVFDSTHELLFRYLVDGPVTGLRIDHADGLRNPAEYLRHLQMQYLVRAVTAALQIKPSGRDKVEQCLQSWFSERFNGPAGRYDWALYVIVEKILMPGEGLPRQWAAFGTTGYDFLNDCGGVFIDGSGRKPLSRTYSDFTGSEVDFATLTTSAKKMTMLVSLGSEINALSHQLERIAEKNRRYRDFTLNTLTFALREVIAALPVYRTYITGPDEVSERDREAVETAVAQAKKTNPRTAEEIFDFVRDIILLRRLSEFRQSDRPDLLNWVFKLQQITGPVMAKGAEDTGFYVFNRLVSLNEVGGDPRQFGVPVPEFHRQNAARAQHWPHTLLASSTHDTKRSEDVRARVHVISELPGEWAQVIARWSRLNSARKTAVDGKSAPDRNDEYLLYQTLVGTWPVRSQDRQVPREDFTIFRTRILEYMKKAVREAKVHTSWVNPNKQYEQALTSFIINILDETQSRDFVRDCSRFARRLAHFGHFNSLSQLLLKLTSPGVPDIYQGSELWNLQLVDPDNREPVDWGMRSSLLAQLKERLSATGESGRVRLGCELLETIGDGRIKLYVTQQTLNFRRMHPDLFQNGDYTPVAVQGARSPHVCAFLRHNGAGQVVAVVPRLLAQLTRGEECAPLGKVWEDTSLVLPGSPPEATYRNVLTGETLQTTPDGTACTLPIAAVLAHFPVALLERMPLGKIPESR